jgi:predicted amidophosphoribosyltransferase
MWSPEKLERPDVLPRDPFYTKNKCRRESKNTIDPLKYLEDACLIETAGKRFAQKMKIFSEEIAVRVLGASPRTIAAYFLDLALPPVCPICGTYREPSERWCTACRRALEIAKAPLTWSCPRCGLPIPHLPAPTRTATTFSTSSSPGTGLSPADASDSAAGHAADLNIALECSNCRSRQDSPVDRTFALFAYTGIVCNAVVASKHSYRMPITLSLGRSLGEHVARHFSQTADAQVLQNDRHPIDWVTWVPSSHTRRWVRGGNSVSQMAYEVAVRIAVPTIDCLKTTRRLRKQAWLNDSERQKNVSGAFAARKRYALQTNGASTNTEIADKHILVVDDVMTTGATTNEIARVLKRVGAARVSVAVVARAIRT